MAIDTVYKRFSVRGVGRPWMRGAYPDAAKGAVWRATIGNVYAGNEFASDSTAPILTLITAVATAFDAMAGTIETDEIGVLYYLVSLNASELESVIKTLGDSQTVSVIGEQNITKNGLLANTLYYLHCVQDDLFANESNVLSSPWFLTPDSFWSEGPSTGDDWDEGSGGTPSWNEGSSIGGGWT